MTNTTINDLPIVKAYNKTSGFFTWFMYYLRTQGLRILGLSLGIILSFLGFGYLLSDMEAEDFVILFQTIAVAMVIGTVAKLRKLFEDKEAPIDSYKLLLVKLYMSFLFTGMVISIMNVYISIQGRLLDEGRQIAALNNNSPQNAKEGVVVVKKLKVKEAFRKEPSLEEKGIEQLNGFNPATTTTLVSQYEYGENKDVNKTFDYIKRFAPVAQKEQQQFGIPASITLAQGILESKSGSSVLCKRSNNHFGIKTWLKSVKHVVFHDDAPNDKFRVYNSAWESYRDHSIFLMRPNYSKCHSLKPTDYKGWAKGLKACGYATEKSYDKDLIGVIEKYQLYKFDRF